MKKKLNCFFYKKMADHEKLVKKTSEGKSSSESSSQNKNDGYYQSIDNRRESNQVPQLQRSADLNSSNNEITQLQSLANNFIQFQPNIIQRIVNDNSSEISTEERLNQQEEQVKSNDVTEEQVDAYRRGDKKAIEGFSLNKAQLATVKARLAGTVGNINNFDAHFLPDDDVRKIVRNEAKEKIPTPEDIFEPSEIEAHLQKFANGAHAYFDLPTSHKIQGHIHDPRFKGWGIDANFVAPVDEANTLNDKARKDKGIVTIEKALGIGGWWSDIKNNPGKILSRWYIPKPKLKLDNETTGILLSMVTGKETGADPKLWVAGGLTKGGFSEAKIDAIPRKDLAVLISDGKIENKIEKYPMTPDPVTPEPASSDSETKAEK